MIGKEHAGILSVCVRYRLSDALTESAQPEYKEERKHMQWHVIRAPFLGATACWLVGYILTPRQFSM
jgi:hypothetical protein